MKRFPRIGIFGGSFDPPHIGHLLASLYALQIFQLDEVWFVPANQHAFQKRLLSFRDRLSMCRLLVRKVSPRLRVSTIERDIESDGRMLFTLQALAKKYPRKKFVLLLGSDSSKDFGRWYKFESIKKKFGVLLIPRGNSGKGKHGFGIPNISSTDIRKRIRSRKSLEGILSPAVADYVIKKKLYRKHQ